ncbi:MAG: sensor histidine kinase, partial [Chloroflexota bacterium]
AAEWEDTKALVRATMGDLRTSLAGLRLPALEEQPLTAALRGLASELEARADIQVAVSVADGADRLDRSAQEALYRVAQEALANVAKHARARHVSLTLQLRSAVTQLEVADDGVGLSAAPRTGDAHYGIVGMRERVEALGGILTLGPGPDGGTILRASVQLEEKVDARYPHPVG